ncbi:MAG: ABC transporter ATP-binding protein [Deltaproteobacteria bacterium]|nr:ABC transporter ATP-binding protein [Deltaproteobacteria bacterium]
MPILEFKNVQKIYGSTLVLSEINFRVDKGEFLSLLGPSGCGKTTTLRLIAGLEEPTEGTIGLDGQVVADGRHFVPPEKRNLGMVFQSYAIWPHMDVFDNIAYPLRVRKRSRDEIRNRTGRVLKALGLERFGKRHPDQLSGGQQQRVALGRALVMEPLMLLLDEPLSNLDAKLRIGMRQEIKQIQKDFQTTVVYVTHDQTEAMEMSNWVIVMNQGKIEQQGSPNELRNQPATEFVREFLS